MRTMKKAIFKINYSRILSAKPKCIRTIVSKNIVTKGKCRLHVHHALLRGRGGGGGGKYQEVPKVSDY